MAKTHIWMKDAGKSGFCVSCGKPITSLCGKCSGESLFVWLCSVPECLISHKSSGSLVCQSGLINQWRDDHKKK